MKRQTKKENLFVATGDLSDVVLNWYGESIEKLDFYSQAYHSAAQVLMENSSDDQLRDIGACPVVFLYRMSLELSLKALLISGSKILQHQGEPSNAAEKILARRHNLSELLKDLRVLYKQLDLAWDAEHAEKGRFIIELDRKDPGSFCFRYPVKIDGAPALEQDFRFDLRRFSSRMDEVLAFLDQIDCGLAGILEQMQEAALANY